MRFKKSFLGGTDFFSPEDAEAWYEDGGLDKCPSVCGVAARIGAEVILEFRKRK